MDGSSRVYTNALDDIVERGMRDKLDFNVIRAEVAEFLKKKGCFCTGTERVGETTFVILITYWDETGQTRAESFDEWPTYTKKRHANAW